MDSLPTVPLPSRAQGGGVAHVSGAVDVVRRVDHGSDVQESDPSLVQVVVDVVGNLLRLPTPGEVVADEMCLADECMFRARRPRKADRAQSRPTLRGANAG
jgi:hypothetical protein